MKKLSFALLAGLIFVFPVQAQAEPSLTSADILEVNLEGAAATPSRILPKINSIDFFKMRKVATFDASESILIDKEHGVPSFYWEFSDGVRRWGEKITRVFQHSGRFSVKLVIKQGSKSENRVTLSKEFTVYDQQIAWISDDIKKHENVVAQAGEHGIWLLPIAFESDKSGFSGEEDFLRRIQENMEFLKDADGLIFQTKAASALQSFTQLWQKLSEENRFDPRNKLWVQLAEGAIVQNVKLVQPSFSVIRPKFMLLTRWEAFEPIFENVQNFEELESILRRRGIDFQLVDERTATSPVLIFSKLTTYFVSHGISQNVIYLLLAVPFLTFVIAFFRQFVGISTFGVYAPLMLSLSFLVLGLTFGFLVFLMVLFISYLIRLLFVKVDLLYIPKVSLLLSALALSFFLVLGLAVYFQSPVNLTLAIFPMLVMATISEKFLSAQSEEGMRGAIIATTETTLVALIGYFFVTWGWVEARILSLPELVILPILGNIWLGRFTGLRLSEYFKFNALFRDDAAEEEE